MLSSLFDYLKFFNILECIARDVIILYKSNFVQLRYGL